MKIHHLILILFAFISCQNKTSQKDKVEEKTIIPEKKIEEIAEVKNIEKDDDDFMRFFDNFMWDYNLQKERVIYPIKIDSTIISKSQDWIFLPFYTSSQFSIQLIQDSIEALGNSNKLDSITLSILSVKKMSENRFEFINHDSKWKLIANNKKQIENSADYEFITFLANFSKDSIFQKEHIKFPLDFHTLDYDKDYEGIDTIIKEKNWKFLNLESDLEKIFFINDKPINNEHKSLIYQGIENGISISFYFKKIDSEWKLISWRDQSM